MNFYKEDCGCWHRWYKDLGW